MTFVDGFMFAAGKTVFGICASLGILLCLAAISIVVQLISERRRRRK